MRFFVRAAAAAALLCAAAPAAGQEEGSANATAAAPGEPAPARTPSRFPPPLPRPAPLPKPESRTPAPEAPAPPAPEAPAAPTAPKVRPTGPRPVTAAAPVAPLARGARAEPAARTQPGQTIAPQQLETFVDGVVRSAMARRHIAGVTVAIVQNGEVLMKKGYGFASLSPARPVDPDRTLFRIGSASKTFTWIGVMRAAEAGRIQLDQPVNLYLPERLQIREQGFDQPVRVLDLMDHAAGFEDRAYDRLVESDPDYVRPLDLYLRQERPRRVRPPGEIATYSDYGAALAGEALSSIEGKPFERLIEEQIFLPLGMSHTTFRERRAAKAALPAPMPADLADGAAEGFRWTAGGFVQQPYEYMGQAAPAGAASSTAGDMARYMLALLGGGQLGPAVIYGPRTAQALRTPILSVPPGINGWAHGFMAEPLPGGRTGLGETGETLSFAARLVTAPDLNLGIFVAANTDTARELVEDLPREVVREFYPPAAAPPRAGAPELAPAAGLYAGRYRTTRRAYSGLEAFIDGITGASRVRVTPEGRLVTTDASGARAWTPEGTATDGRFVALDGEERLAFRIVDGRAVGYQHGANLAFFERVSFLSSPEALALAGGLTAAAALLTLTGAALRNHREQRESAVQSRAALIQNIQAGLWLAAMAAFAVWGARAIGDPARLTFTWPGALLVTASSCALVAAALTATTLVTLPSIWRGGRRVDSWPILRRAAFTVTVAVYAVFSWLLAQAGALSPWSG